jgi:3-hydroxyacyl-[acyl-carrier-protein] dehydratase
MRLEYFQMLDCLGSLDKEGEAIVAKAVVPGDSPVFAGHFPGYPLVPGVLLLETMAQASGYLLLALDGISRMPFFACAKAANFRSFVLPGNALVIEAKRIHKGSGYSVTHSRILRDGKQVCDAQLMFRTVPFPAPALEEHVRGECRRLGLGAAE